MHENNTRNEHTGNKSRRWKGYNIDELERLHAVNTVRCGMIKKRLAVTYNGIMASFTFAGSENFHERFTKTVTWTSYGVQFYRYARTIISLYRKVKKTFGSTTPSSTSDENQAH